jgi:hypothetical protein
VNDNSIPFTGGLQQIKTWDGYVIPLVVQDRLARLPICPYTDTEWDSLPHVFLTAEREWDPTIMDHKFKEDEPWGDDTNPVKGNKSVSPFDDFGNYWHRVVVRYTDFFQPYNGSIDLDDIIDQCVHYSHQPFVEEDTVVFYDAHEHEIDGNNIDDI